MAHTSFFGMFLNYDFSTLRNFKLAFKLALLNHEYEDQDVLFSLKLLH